MNRIYKVIWSKVSNQYVVVSELARKCTKNSSSSVGAVRKVGVLLATLALTAGISGMSVDAATNGAWTTATDGKGNFTAHIDTANTMGQYAENNKVLGDENTVNTRNNKVTGDTNTLGSSSGYDYVIGDGNAISVTKYSWIIGNNNQIYTKPNGFYREYKDTLIFGNNNTSTEHIGRSIFIGSNNNVTQGINDSIAIGNGMKFGRNTDGSVIIGHEIKNGALPRDGETIARGPGSNNSVVIGSKNTNESPGSIILGYNSKIGNDVYSAGVDIVIGNQVSIGDNADHSIAIGSDGTRVDDETDWTTIMGHKVTIGIQSDQSLAIGGTGTSIGSDAPHSTAVGSIAKVIDGTWYGTAVGYESSVSGRSSIALGNEATIGIDKENFSRYAVALGFQSKVGGSAENGIAIGNGANVKDGAQSGLAVGDSSNKRRIINVAKGRISATSYDAINGQQIYHLTNDLTDQIAAAGGSVLAGTNIASVEPGTDADGKKQYTVNAKGASVSVDDNFVLTPTEDATTNVTDYNIKLNDVVTIGAGNPIKIDGTKGYITGLTNKTLEVEDFAKVGRAATEEQLSAAMSDIDQKSYKGWTVSANGADGVAVASKGKVDFSGVKDTTGHQNIVVAQKDTNLTFDLNTSINVGTGDNKVTIDGDNASVQVGTGDNKVAIDGTSAIVNVGKNVSIDGQAGKADIGRVNVDGSTGEVKGLTNVKLDGKDFATVGRAATEEQLNAAITDIKNSAYTGWNITANEENKTTVGKDTTIDFGGYINAEGNQNVFVRKDNAKLKFGLNNKITIGEGNTKAVINGEAGTFNLGTEEGKAVSLNGTTGMGEVGVIALNGADGEVTGLTNTTLTAEDFATVGRAATEEQLQGVNEQVINNSNAIVNLGGKVNELDNRIDKVGAGAAALAALHPLDFDPDDKWDVTAGYGHYRGENSVALGAFYRPNEDTMFSVGGTIGNGNSMVNAGISLKVGQGNNVSTSKVAMAKEIKDLRRELEALKSAMLDSNAGRKIDTSKLQLFPDVPQNHWAYEYVAVLAGNGMIKGNADGNFAGDRPLTRYEFAQMLYDAMLNGATLSDKILTEFAPELERFTVDAVHTDKDGNPTVERVRVKK